MGEEPLAEMEQAAEELRFEKAAEPRDRFKAIELLGKRQKVVAGSLADTDVVGFPRGGHPELLRGAPLCGGRAGGQGLGAHRDPYGGGTADILSALVAAVLRRPGPPAPADPPALRGGGRGPLMRLFVRAGRAQGGADHPQRGAKMDLIRLANKNAVEEVERWTTREGSRAS